MNELTQKYLKINDHINHTKGTKTVCVTTCLSFLGVPFDSYSYTSSDKNLNAWIDVLRRSGRSVRSRKSEFKAGKLPTMTALKKNIKKSAYTANDLFVVDGVQQKKAHLMVLNGEGETLIDTAPKMKWRIRHVAIVE